MQGILVLRVVVRLGILPPWTSTWVVVALDVTVQAKRKGTRYKDDAGVNMLGDVQEGV